MSIFKKMFGPGPKDIKELFFYRNYEELFKLLEHGNAMVREEALYYLYIAQDFHKERIIAKGKDRLVNLISLLITTTAKDNLDKLTSLLNTIEPKWKKSEAAKVITLDLVNKLGDPQLQPHIIYVLGEIEDTRALEKLVALFKTSRDLDTRMTLVTALNKINREWIKRDAVQAALDEFINQLLETDEKKRQYAAFYLDQIEARRLPRTREDLLALFTASRDPDTRLSLAEALNKINPEWIKSDALAAAVSEFINQLLEADNAKRGYAGYIESGGHFAPGFVEQFLTAKSASRIKQEEMSGLRQQDYHSRQAIIDRVNQILLASKNEQEEFYTRCHNIVINFIYEYDRAPGGVKDETVQAMSTCIGELAMLRTPQALNLLQFITKNPGFPNNLMAANLALESEVNLDQVFTLLGRN
jgi:hypothetical protein